jgi:phi LC3 family holin
MKINLKVRFKNPMFYVQLVLSILTPILAYSGLTATDLTTWAKLGEVLVQAISNPYVLSLVIVSVYNALVDPTTKGFGDSETALTYDKPKQ